MDLDDFQSLASQRRTVKWLADSDQPVAADDRGFIERLIQCAGWAPFHKMCSPEHRQEDGLPGIQPWRFYALDAASCRRLRGKLEHLPAAGKIPAMLSAARALVMATWLPDGPSIPGAAANSSDHECFIPNLMNVEHIAATAAAIQTLLLAATAAGLGNYWSSGGVLRLPSTFEMLGIPIRERLLGAVFLFPASSTDAPGIHIALSKLRASRGESTGWQRWVEV